MNRKISKRSQQFLARGQRKVGLCGPESIYENILLFFPSFQSTEWSLGHEDTLLSGQQPCRHLNLSEKIFLSGLRNWERRSPQSEECEENPHYFFSVLSLETKADPFVERMQQCRQVKIQLCNQKQKNGLSQS